ncbi:alpha/beta hydrolase-fold protein [Winogradskyella sp.]|uniref:alpha/beta hydrolase-fold protein n=1 Tax=Winogradskyella sp. TaxID=1883156 RepID=UPI00260A17EF|nr:alpha/beta hydrolase-fold protein [Winogradskyella sp.]
MNQKIIVLGLAILFVANVFGQEKRTIKVIVPNKTDEVFITGNQESLGNWNPNRVKMEKVSDYERSLTVDLNYPAEFKFTKGDWNSEAIIKKLHDNPNLRLENRDSKNIFMVKGWSNDKAGDFGLDYSVAFFPSKYVNEGRQIKVVLPKNYDAQKKYPVCYITDAEWRNFEVAKNYLESLAGEPYDIVPETILVGIVHGMTGNVSNRNKDLDVYYNVSGKKFKNFLFKELIPHINDTYSTSGFNVMIGHSNGAEYSHHLLLEQDNPFRGFISISTNFYSRDVRREMAEFMRNYGGKPMYYFVANSEFDSPDRIEAGDDYEKIYKANKNDRISFQKKLFEGGHNSMVPASLFEGLRFIFKDFKNQKNYPTFYAYKNNYLKDMKAIYGLEVNYNLSDMGNLLNAIFDNKKESELTDYFDFVEEHKLWQNYYMKEPGGLDAMNKGNQYFVIESYKKSAEQYAMALEQLEITVEPAVYYYNYDKIVESFKQIGQYNALMELLIKSKDLLYNNPEFLSKSQKVILLALNFEIAKLFNEQNINRKAGKKALNYCKENFVKNSYFTLEELEELI